MNKMERYKRLEKAESSWTIAQRWARFGELAAAQLAVKSIDKSEIEKELSIEIQTLAKSLVKGLENKDQSAIETVAKEWESPDLDKEGLTTCAEIFSKNKGLLAAFHATQIGQMEAIGYSDKELQLPIEVASIYRTLEDYLPETLEEIYEHNFGSLFEECFP